ncbi:Uncharacterised protein [uncultured archaeon]|nr:Uncharacterised protein [uncultured archaeon]
MMKLLMAALIALLLLCGCTGSGAQAAAGAGAQQPAHGSFVVPASGIDYSAQYVVYEGSTQVAKRVFRSGDRMRADVYSQGGNTFSIYLSGSFAYSCYSAGGPYECYDISAKLSQEQVDGMVAQPSLSGAKEAEDVDIGGTTGKCYAVPYDVYRQRKLCFTDRGVLAYDEYNATKESPHIEYLSSISYAASDSDFQLPASPQALPQ